MQPEREIVNTEKIAARRLSLEEVTKLGVKDRLFISADTAELKLPDCYVPAFLTKSGEDFEGGSITARTVFQEEVSWLPDDENEAGIYLADENGSVTIEVLQSAGVVLDLALFVPSGTRGLSRPFTLRPGRPSAPTSCRSGARASRRFPT